MKKIQDSDSTLTTQDVVFGNAFWEFLDALDVSLYRILRHVNRSFRESSIAQLSFIGVHFGDPRASVGALEGHDRVYYERVSGHSIGIKKRSVTGYGKPPPILDLVSNLSGWCPVTSVLLHLTSSNHWINAKDVPKDCFCISMRNIKRSNFDEPSANEKADFLQERWNDIYIIPPKRWRSPETVSEFFELMHFRLDQVPGQDRHNIRAADETFDGLRKSVPDGLTDHDRDSVLSYENSDIMQLLRSKKSDKPLKPSDPRYKFVDHLMKCFHDGLGSISLEDIKQKSNAKIDRYIYYMLPGSTKGRTAAGYFICDAPLNHEVIPELQTLFLPFGLIVLDGMICIQDLHGGPRSSSEIMSKVYQLSLESK